MNFLLLAAIGAGCVLFLWLTQSVALFVAGEPQAWPLRTTSADARVKWARRAAVQMSWFALILAFPAVIGTGPVTYFAAAFPPPDWGRLGLDFGICVGVLCVGYAVEVALGWVRWEPLACPRVLRKKLLRRFLLSIPLALVEEAVFRGIVLESMVRALPTGLVSQATALVASSAAFAAVHFLRPDPGRPFWQPAAGFFTVGAVCGTAYLACGHTLWIPATIHAAGILVSETARLFTVNRGPRLFAGYQCYPHCGLFGVTTLVALAAILLR